MLALTGRTCPHWILQALGRNSTFALWLLVLSPSLSLLQLSQPHLLALTPVKSTQSSFFPLSFIMIPFFLWHPNPSSQTFSVI
ncbi:rCG28672, isoform CRA_b [Rattus norvegicus]|uniref:RCG28672, isoform CRA_b n=1 Tax=Rattus norvegicus TaxID=10116 RepID=A6HUW6_RAT|nr:rCG28672, isoform CRA_b [Rattus norvegicus]